MFFFGLLIQKSPMERLVEHYEKIQQSVDIINESLECYISGGQCVEFKTLQNNLNELESQADKIIRSIRNHLPRSLFMPVDKVIFLSYTSAQDDILDSAQDALNWLSMKNMVIPEKFQKELIYMLDDVGNMIYLLGPALKNTISLVHLDNLDREGTKEQYRKIRDKKHHIFKSKNQLIGRIYRSDLEFKEIYQLIHFTENMYTMCHSCSKCVEILRSMIAR
ncbi:MAG: DUF47 domain-containing protein [Desulfonatronovibrio sp.]